MTKVFNRLNIAAVTQEVFDSWDTKRQKEYLDQHPNSKFAKQNGKTGQSKVEPRKNSARFPVAIFKNEKSFENYSKNLSKKLGVTLKAVHYDKQDGFISILANGQSYALTFRPNTGACYLFYPDYGDLATNLSKSNKYELNNLESYKSFNEMLKEADFDSKPSKKPDLPKGKVEDYIDFLNIYYDDKEFFNDFLYEFEDVDNMDIDEILESAYDTAKELLHTKNVTKLKKAKKYYQKLKHYENFIRNNEEYFREKANG